MSPSLISFWSSHLATVEDGYDDEDDF